MAPSENENRERERDRDDREPSLHRLDRNIAVMAKDLDNFKISLERRLDGVESKLGELQSSFIQRVEFEGLRKEHESLRNSITWGVRIVLSVIIVAVMGMVLVKGGVRPT